MHLLLPGKTEQAMKGKRPISKHDAAFGIHVLNSNFNPIFNQLVMSSGFEVEKCEKNILTQVSTV